MKRLFISSLIIVLNNLMFSQIEGFFPLENRYALVIGISKYANSNNNLTYASKDAEDFAKLLKNIGRFKEENIRLLLDSDATRENFRKNIQGWLKTGTDKNSTIIIFFSGHGSQYFDYNNDEIDGMDEYLVTYDFDASDFSSIISDDDFSSWIKDLKSERVLLFLDCCFSGGAAKQKGFLTPGVKGGIIKDNFIDDIATKELPKEGVCLLAASKSDQVSYESDELKNGVFTYNIIHSVTTENDIDFNNIISETEIFNFTYTEVVNYTSSLYGRAQEPIILTNLKKSLDLFYLPPQETKSKDSEKYNLLKYRLAEEKDFDKQREILEEMFALDSNDFNTIQVLIWHYERVKKYDKALYFLTLLKSQTNADYWDEHIGDVYFEMGNLNDALKWYQKTLDTEKNPSTMYKMGETFLNQNDTLNAIKYFNMSLRVNPYQKKSYTRLLYMYLNSNELNLANEIVNSSYIYNPSDLEIIYWLALFKKKNKNFEEADSLLDYFYGKTRIRDRLEAHERGSTPSRNNDINFAENYVKYAERDFNRMIRDYWYVADIYKAFITICYGLLLPEEQASYIKKYILLSKLFPDTDFINKYIGD